MGAGLTARAADPARAAFKLRLDRASPAAGDEPVYLYLDRADGVFTQGLLVAYYAGMNGWDYAEPALCEVDVSALAVVGSALSGSVTGALEGVSCAYTVSVNIAGDRLDGTFAGSWAGAPVAGRAKGALMDRHVTGTTFHCDLLLERPLPITADREEEYYGLFAATLADGASANAWFGPGLGNMAQGYGEVVTTLNGPTYLGDWDYDTGRASWDTVPLVVNLSAANGALSGSFDVQLATYNPATNGAWRYQLEARIIGDFAWGAYVRVQGGVTSAVQTLIGQIGAPWTDPRGPTGFGTIAPAPADPALTNQAAQASLVPVWPGTRGITGQAGVAGATTYWANYMLDRTDALYPPTIAFQPVPGAVTYRYRVGWQALGTFNPLGSFETNDVRASVASLWDRLPTAWADTYQIRCAGLDAPGGNVLAPGEQIYPLNYRRPWFSGPYYEPLAGIADFQARIEASVRWLKDSRRHNLLKSPLIACRTQGEGNKRYGSIEVVAGGIAQGMVLLHNLTPDPAVADAALTLAEQAGDWSMAWRGYPIDLNEYYKGMVWYALSAGHAYLDLYAATHDEKWAYSAMRQGQALAHVQQANGQWTMSSEEGGVEVTDRDPSPEYLEAWVTNGIGVGDFLEFFGRLRVVLQTNTFVAVEQAAMAYAETHDLRTFIWLQRSGKFDDVERRMHGKQPSRLCLYMLDGLPDADVNLGLVEEIVRWIEDRCVLWDRGATNTAFRPCVYEHWERFPDNNPGATARMALLYLKLYERTANPLYRAKGEALALALLNQQHRDGLIFESGATWDGDEDDLCLMRDYNNNTPWTHFAEAAKRLNEYRLLQAELDSKALEPAFHASHLVFNAIETNRMTIAWTPGDGSDRIVVMRAGAAVNWAPSDHSPYPADTDFALAADQADGNKVIYNGGGTSLTVTGLQPGTVYHVAVFEYHGAGAGINYRTWNHSDQPLLIGSARSLPTVPALVIQHSAGATAVTEGGASDSYGVRLSVAPSDNVTLSLDDADGQVTSDPEHLVFTPTSWSNLQVVTVTALDDLVVEIGLTVTNTYTAASADTGYNGLSAQAMVTVEDNDAYGTLRFAGGANVAETGGLVTVIVARVDGVAGAVQVGYHTVDGSASAGADYVATNGTLSWSSGDATPKPITLRIADDASFEGNESFLVVLTNVAGGGAVGDPAAITVLVVDNELPMDPYETVGIYDEQVIQVNAVDRTAGATSNAAYVIGLHTNAAEDADYIGFTQLVAAAWANHAGGVINFDNGDIYDRRTNNNRIVGCLVGVYGQASSKALSMYGEGPAGDLTQGFMEQANGDNSSRATSVSGAIKIFKLSNLAIAAADKVTHIGITWGSRRSSAVGNAYVAAKFSDGQTAQAFRNIPLGESLYDTFFGFESPPGAFITNLAWSGGTMNCDDLAFVINNGVPPNDPPTVSLTAPTNGGILAIGAACAVAGTASDPDGTVTSVTVRADGVPLGAAIGLAAWRYDWVPGATGVFSLTAVACDDGGAVTTSVVVNVTVAGDNDADGQPDPLDPDDDNDGMPDTWEAAYGLDPHTAGAESRGDRDRFTDFEEYIAGTDPTDAASFLSIADAWPAGDAAGLVFDTVAGRYYQVEDKTSLSAAGWSLLLTNHAGDGQPFTVADPRSAPARFYRIKVRMTPWP